MKQSSAVHIPALYSADGILLSISNNNELFIINLAAVPGGQLVNSPTAQSLVRYEHLNHYTMRIFKYIFFIPIYIIPSLALAQEESWDVYMAQYEKGAGSVVINMSIKNIAPVKKLPFILITGVKYSDCSSDGMPSKNEFTRLYSISDSVKAIMDKFVENKAVGTFTYQCERLDYYYIKDTLELRQALSKLYSTHFKSYDPYINIKEDKNWDAYLSFLYPNEETFEYMQNQKVIQHLEDSGDKLEKARKVDHWIYFHTETDRNCFINYITKHNFKIELKEKTDDANRPYKLQISRVDKVDLPSISGITIDLRKESKKCNGDYDGWETLVIK